MCVHMYARYLVSCCHLDLRLYKRDCWQWFAANQMPMRVGVVTVVVALQVRQAWICVYTQQNSRVYPAEFACIPSSVAHVQNGDSAIRYRDMQSQNCNKEVACRLRQTKEQSAIIVYNHTTFQAEWRKKAEKQNGLSLERMTLALKSWKLGGILFGWFLGRSRCLQSRQCLVSSP